MADEFVRPSDSDIMAYRPVLTKEPVINTEGDTSFFTEREAVAHTPAVLQIGQNPPNRAIGTLSRMNDNISSMISTLESQLNALKVDDISFQDYRQAVIDDDPTVTGPFLDYHRNDIKGDTRVEIYDNLVRLQDEAINIQELSSTILYGVSDITFETAQEKDDALAKKLVEYENKGWHHKINYAALAFDIQINKVLSDHADVLQQHASKLFSMVFASIPEKFTVPTESLTSTINNIFCDCALKNNDDRKKLTSILKRSLVEEALVNVFNKRTNLLNLINSKQILTGIINNSSVNSLLQSIDDTTVKTNDYIVELNKAILTSAMYREDYLTTLKQKQDIRNVNSSLA